MSYEKVTAMRRITRIALFAALMAVGSWISIPVGPVPITLQTLFLLLAGLCLGPKDGALAALLFLAAGALGLPVFSGGKGGPAIFLGPTGGFLVGFPLAAWFYGFAGRKARQSLPAAIALCCLGASLYYLAGTLRFMQLMGTSFGATAAVTILPFMPGAILKLWAALAAHRYLLRCRLL